MINLSESVAWSWVRQIFAGLTIRKQKKNGRTFSMNDYYSHAVYSRYSYYMKVKLQPRKYETNFAAWYTVNGQVDRELLWGEF